MGTIHIFLDRKMDMVKKFEIATSQFIGSRYDISGSSAIILRNNFQKFTGCYDGNFSE